MSTVWAEVVEDTFGAEYVVYWSGDEETDLLDDYDEESPWTIEHL